MPDGVLRGPEITSLGIAVNFRYKLVIRTPHVRAKKMQRPGIFILKG